MSKADQAEDRRLAEEFLPLNQVHFLILLVLMDGEAHGYRLVKEIESRSPTQQRIQPGNLYRSLRTMVAQGLIEESDARPDPAVDDQRRRYFKIAEAGISVARLEAARLDTLLEAARHHHLLASGGSNG